MIVAEGADEMAATSQNNGVGADLVSRHLSLAGGIASRLHRWYSWVGLDDLKSYAYLGLTLAARTYCSRRGTSFADFASRKAMFLAIDEMRKDGVIRRRRAKATPTTTSLTGRIADPGAGEAYERLERRDTCAALLGKLRAEDRQLLIMYYGQELTFKEIAKVFEISESAVCLRHKALLGRLRKLAAAGGMV
jgi:RNA polymerase sigma factor (sigma-70 family)